MNRKTALVTNALDFVGPPAVDALVADGFDVLAHDAAFADEGRREAFLKQHAGVGTTGVEDPAQLIARAVDALGRLDVIVSNDAYPAIHVPVDEADVADLQATIDRLVVYPYRLMQAAIPRLKAQARGNVILVTSCRTELPLPGGAIPDIARAGANALVQSLSIELAPFGIPVNAIAPNYLYSEAYFPRAKFIDDPAGRAYIRDVVPAGRLGEPREIGELVSYLAGMEGSFHTGTVIKFAGGWPAAPQRPV
ncbi:MAG: SDR family oxidoreductase [Pseudomonadota bacterium]